MQGKEVESRLKVMFSNYATQSEQLSKNSTCTLEFNPLMIHWIFTPIVPSLLGALLEDCQLHGCYLR